MANYITPGVYVEEDLTPKTAAGYGDARAVASFVGILSKGPSRPTRIKSWTQFVNLFGGFDTPGSLMPFAVYMFFQNGGGNCYIVRATRSDAVQANVTLKDSTPAAAPDNGPKDAFKVTAYSPGVGGNDLKINTVPTGATGRFHFIVSEGTRELERFEDLSADPQDSRYVVSVVNSPVAGSQMVTVSNVKVTANPSYVYNATTDLLPAQTGQLGSGAEGSAPYDLVAAAKLLSDVEDNIDLNLPGVSSQTVINPLLAWAKEKGKIFLILDGPKGAEGATSGQIVTGYTGLIEGVNAFTANSYGAVYGPWLMCSDPSTNLYGAMRLLPPGGAVMGKFARNDTVRHVGKAPAGTETVLQGVISCETRFTPTELDTLAEAHINVIRRVPGHGICIMGSRTLWRELPDRYVPVRRTLIMLRKQLNDITKFAVFEPNGPDLWTTLTLVCNRYLTHLMRAGVLGGRNESESFFVKCDEDNNTQQTINAGRVNVDIGVSLRYPAEFIIITIGQKTDGSSETTELLR